MLIESIPKAANDPAQQPIQNGPSQNQVPVSDKPVQSEMAADVAQSKAVVADIQNNLQVLNNADLAFSVDESSGNVVVTVTDADSGEVIRQIPPKETLALAEKLEEMVGLVFDQTA